MNWQTMYYEEMEYRLTANLILETSNEVMRMVWPRRSKGWRRHVRKLKARRRG